MSQFFRSLLYAAVAGGISAATVGKAYEKHVRYLAALLCTAVILTPLLSLVPDFDTVKPDVGEYASADEYAAARLVGKQAAQDAEVAVTEYIFSQTGIKPREISIQIESKEEGLCITGVSVSIASNEEAEIIKHCLTGLFGNGVPIEVRVHD